MKTSAEVVIIGAGVIGCSTAYHLAVKGITDVVVVEMAHIGAGSSGKSASMLSLQFGKDRINAHLALYSYDRYMAFEDEIGTPIDFKKIGWLSIAAAEREAEIHAHTAMLQGLGISTELVSLQDIIDIYPEMETSGICMGSFGVDDGPFDPHMIMSGYVKRARQMGVRFLERARAQNVLIERDHVVGVVTDLGSISTNIVVNAAGPWAKEVGRWVGVNIPVENKKRSVVVSGPISAALKDRPFVEDVAGEWYFRPEGEGLLLGMGEVPTERIDEKLDSGTISKLLEVSTARIPALQSAAVLTTWSGLRPCTPDGRPILGEVPTLDGYFLNCGWGGMGIIQAPAAGQLLSERIIGSKSPIFDLNHFRITRFI